MLWLFENENFAERAPSRALGQIRLYVLELDS